MAEKTDDRKISEALELLNEVAKDKQAELRDMVSDQYGNLMAALGGIAEKAQQQARETYEQGKEKLLDLASDVDASVHKNPWPYVGGAALGSLILGYFLARPRK